MTKDFSGKNNGFYGRKHSEESKEKMRIAAKRRIGEKSPTWKGNKAKYMAIHAWFGKHFPVRQCEECETKEGSIEVALKHGRYYSRNIDDYRFLCKSCHRKYDQTGVKFSEEHKKKLGEAIRKSWVLRRAYAK